jgi:hypothetical protein
MKLRTARTLIGKPYTCWKCKATINNGEQYLRKTKQIGKDSLGQPVRLPVTICASCAEEEG